MSDKKNILFEIICKTIKKNIVIHEQMTLKEDLQIDSVNLVQLSIEIHEKFGIDLGEKVDQGFSVNTVKDLLLCLE